MPRIVSGSAEALTASVKKTASGGLGPRLVKTRTSNNTTEHHVAIRLWSSTRDLYPTKSRRARARLPATTDAVTLPACRGQLWGSSASAQGGKYVWADDEPSSDDWEADVEQAGQDNKLKAGEQADRSSSASPELPKLPYPPRPAEPASRLPTASGSIL